MEKIPAAQHQGGQKKRPRDYATHDDQEKKKDERLRELIGEVRDFKNSEDRDILGVVFALSFLQWEGDFREECCWRLRPEWRGKDRLPRLCVKGERTTIYRFLVKQFLPEREWAGVMHCRPRNNRASHCMEYCINPLHMQPKPAQKPRRPRANHAARISTSESEEMEETTSITSDFELCRYGDADSSGWMETSHTESEVSEEEPKELAARPFVRRKIDHDSHALTMYAGKHFFPPVAAQDGNGGIIM